MIEGNPPLLAPRHEVIANTPALHGCEPVTMAALTDVPAAALAASWTGKAAFAHGMVAWLDDPGIGLGERLDLASHELDALPDVGRHRVPSPWVAGAERGDGRC